MRSLMVVLLMASSAMAAPAGPLVTTCQAKSPKDVNLIRVTPSDARQMLVRKTDISLSTSVSGKFASQEVTLEVDIDRDGSVECFTLTADRPEERFTDDDKEELRGSLATGLDFWVFRPYVVNGQPAEVRATYRLQVEPKRLVLPRATSPIKPRF